MRWVVALLLIAVLAWLLLGDDSDRVDPLTSRNDPAKDASPPPLLGVAPGRAAGDRVGSPVAGVAGADASAEDQAASDEDDRLSLRIDTVDARTGRVVRSTWNLGTGDVRGTPFPPHIKLTEEVLSRQRKGIEDAIARWEAAFLPTGSARENALFGGETLTRARYTVRPPDGYVLPTPSGHIAVQLAAGVRHAVYALPLWRETVLDVRLLDPEGQPAKNVGIVTLVAAGRRRAVDWEVRGPGELRIRGIPHMPGEPVRAVLEWGWSGGEEIEEVEEELDQDDVSSAQLVTRVPDELGRPWQVEVRLKESRSLPYFVVETDNDLDFEEFVPVRPLDETPEEAAAANVRFLGQGGKVVQEAWINGEPAHPGDDGWVLLRGLSPGTHTFTARTPGRFSAQQEVQLAAGKTIDVTLREPEGARLEVLVTDGQGRPRPSAHVRLDRRHFDVTDGVQRLDPFTDADGRRSFARVEPGRVTIVATWGSHNGSRSIMLADGETKRVTIVAR